MEKYLHVKVQPPTEDETHAQAAKTTRLRDLRIAKEAADRISASGVTAANAGQHRRGRAPATC
jgi:hypothetical protein